MFSIKSDSRKPSQPPAVVPSITPQYTLPAMPPLVKPVEPSVLSGSNANTFESPNNTGIVVIGKGCRIVGEIVDCTMLEVQGSIEGNVMAQTVVIHESGSVRGQLQAGSAEVHGTFEGRLHVANALTVRETGRLEGELAYGRLSVAMGGYIAGNLVRPVVQEPVDEAQISNVISMTG